MVASTTVQARVHRTPGLFVALAHRARVLLRNLQAVAWRQMARPERAGLSAHMCRDIGEVPPEQREDPIWHAGGSIW